MATANKRQPILGKRKGRKHKTKDDVRKLQNEKGKKGPRGRRSQFRPSRKLLAPPTSASRMDDVFDGVDSRFRQDVVQVRGIVGNWNGVYDK